MLTRERLSFFATVVCLFIAASIAQRLTGSYTRFDNVEYLNYDRYSGKLDIYMQPGVRLRPTVIYFHGGGWVKGATKDGIRISHLPFLPLGWNAVNVEYRDSEAALAPGAIEDSVCALAWVAANAEKYRFDIHRLVVMGDSAGGTLALMAGMISGDTRLNHPCPDRTLPPVAAVIDWSGITDIAPLLEGRDARSFAVGWLGNQAERPRIAAQVSPISYVRAGLPPILMAHSVDDPVVPYAQSAMLHAALDRTGTPNTLITLSGSAHSDFGKFAKMKIYLKMLRFLHEAGVRIVA